MRIGRFRILRPLGEGGTASVHEAVDASGRLVALKLLHPHLADDPARWDAFFEEVRATRAVDHPAIAAVVAWGVEQGAEPAVWIAMELARGRTLAAYVADAGPLNVGEAVAVVDVLLDALGAAHHAGVVHRDVSPANVMLDTDPATGATDPGSVRLLDFGLADIPGRSTRGGDALLSGASGDGVVASAPYASPEHLSGASVVEASDVYQAAATLWFALTGAPVFVGTTAEVVSAHLRAVPPRLSALRPDAPAALDHVVAHALRKHPEDRYDAAGLRRALRGALADPAAGAAQRLALPALATDDVRGHTAVYRADAAAASASDAGPSTASGRLRMGRGRRIMPRLLVATGGAVAVTAVIALAASAQSPAAAPTASVSPPSGSPSPSTTATADALVDVPELIGLARSEAVVVLQRVGLRVGRIDVVDAPFAADTVTDSAPRRGTGVTLGTAVALSVGSGSNTVPEVVGLDVTAATTRLTAAGFTASVESVPGDAPAGTVVSATPQGSRPLGSQVALRISRGPGGASPTPATTPAATPTSTPTATPTPGPTGEGK